MPHFGAILEWELFKAVAHRARTSGTQFILEPHTRYSGEAGEQSTMFLLDPSGNALEFKSFRNPDNVFAT